jgi:cobalamin biosynthesis Mg chelatase CobN
MKNLELVRLVRREARGMRKLIPWVVVSLLLAAVLWRTDLAATSGLFQSPATLTPTTEPTTPTPEAATPTPGTPTQSPTQTVTESPSATPQPSDTPASATPTATDTPSPSPTPDEGQGTQEPDEEGRYPDEDSNVAFEWGMLFDTVALAISRMWLCCGILVLVGIPVAFGILWVASKRREQQEE